MKLNYSLTIGLLLLACACEGVKSGPEGESSQGTVLISLSQDERTIEITTKADDSLPALDDFEVEIYNSRAIRLYRKPYSAAKSEAIKLNAGDFRLVAHHGDSLGAGFGKAYYLADQQFTVHGYVENNGKPDEVSAVAKLGNVKLAVSWGENISTGYSDYYAVIRHSSYSKKSVKFVKNETRSGFIPGGDLYVEVYALDGTIYSGNRKDVYHLLTEKLPGSTEVSKMAFLMNDDEFNANKNELIIQEINEKCEYYINRHNVIGDSYENQYTFTMPEIAGEDWARLLKNPTMISFLQGYSSKADNRYLNIYALGGGELVQNYHYFIDGDEYHCVESDPNVTKTVTPVTTTYESEGRTKVVTTDYIQYFFNGSLIESVYNTQSECAKRGATPHKCIYEWN